MFFQYLKQKIALTLQCCALIAISTALPALAQDQPADPGYSNLWWLVITLLILVQSLLIIGLQRSRLNNKRARKALKQSQKELEQKIAERTENLHSTNIRLQDEIASHEATVLLLRET